MFFPAFLTWSAELKKQVFPRLVRPGGATTAAIAEAERPDDDEVGPPARAVNEDADANDDNDAGDIDKLLPFLFPPPFFLPPPEPPPPFFPPLGMPATMSSCSWNKEQRDRRGFFFPLLP